MPSVVFDPITVIASSDNKVTSLVFDNTQKASDIVVESEKLRHRSATLDNALSDELVIHSNPFGGGLLLRLFGGKRVCE